MSSKKNTCSRLRHRLTLQEEVKATDGAGGYTRTWKDVANLWAEIIPLSGRERLFADQLQTQVTHKVLLRYHGAVASGYRLVFEKRIFNIRAVVNSYENNEVLELMVEEGVAT